ncbi:MAG: hypothetical protein IPK13_14115 [Deltaproteobacteria bacterium]|nr:hypothetical protein [Deltaproteobacteria bacterium]
MTVITVMTVMAVLAVALERPAHAATPIPPAPSADAVATTGVQDVYDPLRRFLAGFQPRSGATFRVAVVAFTDAENRRGRAFAASAEAYARAVFLDWKDRLDRDRGVVIVFGVENRAIALRAGRRWRQLGVEEEVARALVEASGCEAFSRLGDFSGCLVQLIRFLDDQLALRLEMDRVAEPALGREIRVRARHATRLLEEAQRRLGKTDRPDIDVPVAFEDADLALKRAVLLGEADGRTALAQIEATQRTIEEVLQSIQTSSAAAARFDDRLQELRDVLEIFPEGSWGALLGRLGLGLSPDDRAEIERRLSVAERERLALGARRAWPTLLEAGLDLHDVERSIWRAWGAVAVAFPLLAIAFWSLGSLRMRARRPTRSPPSEREASTGTSDGRDRAAIEDAAEGLRRLGRRELARLRSGLRTLDSSFLRRLGGAPEERFDDASLRCLRRVLEAETSIRRRTNHLASMLEDEAHPGVMETGAILRWVAEVESALADLDRPLSLDAEADLPPHASLETTWSALDALVQTLRSLDEKSSDLVRRVARARRHIAKTLPTILEMDSLMARSEGFYANALELDGRIAALGQALLRDPLADDGRLREAEDRVRRLEEEVTTTVALLRTLTERQALRLDRLASRVASPGGAVSSTPAPSDDATGRRVLAEARKADQGVEGAQGTQGTQAAEASEASEASEALEAFQAAEAMEASEGVKAADAAEAVQSLRMAKAAETQENTREAAALLSEPGFEPGMMLSRAGVLLASARRAASGADAAGAKRAALDLDQLLTELEMLVEDASLPADHVSRLIAAETDELAGVVELISQRRLRLEDLQMANSGEALTALLERSQQSDSLAFFVRACLDASRKALAGAPRRNLTSLALVARARRGRKALARIVHAIDELPSRLGRDRTFFERSLQEAKDKIAEVESLQSVTTFRRPWQVDRLQHLTADVRGLESRRSVERPDWTALRRATERAFAQAERLLEDVRWERSAFDEAARVRVSVDRLKASLPSADPSARGTALSRGSDNANANANANAHANDANANAHAHAHADVPLGVLLDAVTPMVKAADDVERDDSGSWLCAAANLAHAEILLRVAERIVEEPASVSGVVERLLGDVSERMAKALLSVSSVSSVDFAEHQRAMHAALRLGDFGRVIGLTADVFTELAKLARNKADPAASRAPILEPASEMEVSVDTSEDPMSFLMGASYSEAFGTSLGRSSFVWRDGERLVSPATEFAEEIG